MINVLSLPLLKGLLKDGVARFNTPAFRWGRLLLLSVAIGVLSGLAARVLESSLQFASGRLIRQFAEPGSVRVLDFHWGVLLLPILGGLLAGIVATYLCRPTHAHGTGVFIEAFHRQGANLSLRDSLLKAAAAVAVIACGGSVGKEAPIAVLCAAIGSALCVVLRTNVRERRIFLVVGCAAGVGAIFQCPLGGALFATTVLYREMDIEADGLMPSIIASVISYSTFMAFGGYGHRLLSGTSGLAFTRVSELIPYTLVAVLCAAIGMLFFASLRFASSLPLRGRLPKFVWPAFGGLVVGLMACGVPQIMDARYEFIQTALNGGFVTPKLTWAMSALLFGVVVIAKSLATSVMIGTDTPGGLFGPVVFMGGGVGAAAGAVLEAFYPGAFPETLRQSLIPVCMAGMLSAALRTPLAAIVMVTEMTGSYGLIVPLMLVSVVSYVLGRRWGVYREQRAGLMDSPAHAGESIVSILETHKVGDVMERPWPYLVARTATIPQIVGRIRSGTHPTFAVLEEGRLVGVISPPDVAAAASLAHSIKVILADDIMTPPPATVSPESDLYSSLDLFQKYELEAIPVVASEGDVFLGMLTRPSILTALQARLAEQREHLLREHAGMATLDFDGRLQALMAEISGGPAGTVHTMAAPDNTVGKSLREVDFRRQYSCQVLAVQSRSGEVLAPPHPDRPIERGDSLIVLQALPPKEAGGGSSPSGTREL